jgi:hypothetical protein
MRGITVSVAAAKAGVKIAYVRGTATVPPGQFFGAPLKCPARFPHPISGLFDSTSNKAALTASRPDPPGAAAASARSWFVGVTNLDTTPAQVGAGVVCAR